MGYFQVRYSSRVVNYNRRAFIRLNTGLIFQRVDSILNIVKPTIDTRRLFLQENIVKYILKIQHATVVTVEHQRKHLAMIWTALYANNLNKGPSEVSVWRSAA